MSPTHPSLGGRGSLHGGVHAWWVGLIADSALYLRQAQTTLANTKIDASLPKIEIFGSFFLVTTAPTGSDLAHPNFCWLATY